MHQARKSDNYGWDEEDKQKVINILRTEFGIAAVRGDTICTLRGTPRIPDLESTNYSPSFYIELDGDYHGFGDDISRTKRTTARNQDYEDLGEKLIILNKSDTNQYDKKLVVERLLQYGIKRI